MRSFTVAICLVAAVGAMSAQRLRMVISSGGGEAPGGFIVEYDDPATRGDTAAGNAAAVPATRGSFLFQSPYNTQAYRITDSTDCTGDCLNFGYALWPRISAGSAGLYYVLVPLNKSQGGGGPTIFSVDRGTHTVTKIGAEWVSGNDRSNLLCETCFWSSTQNQKLYYQYNNVLYLRDVIADTEVAVLDPADADFLALAGSGRGIIQPSASRDDDVVCSIVTFSGNYEAGICTQLSTDKWWYEPGGTGSGQDLQGFDVDGSGEYVHVGDVNGGSGRNRSYSLNANETVSVVWECNNSGASNVCNDVAHVTIGTKLTVMNSGDDGPGASYRFSLTSWSKLLVKSDEDWPYWTGLHLAVWRPATSVAAVDTHVVYSGYDNSVGSEGYGPTSDELYAVRLDGNRQKMVFAPQMLDESESYIRDSHASISGDGTMLTWAAPIDNPSGRMHQWVVWMPTHLMYAAPPAPVTLFDLALRAVGFARPSRLALTSHKGDSRWTNGGLARFAPASKSWK